MGGLIAGCAAALYPERFGRLILADCSSGHATYPKEKREQMLATRLAGLAGGDASDYARKRARAGSAFELTTAREKAGMPWFMWETD